MPVINFSELRFFDAECQNEISDVVCKKIPPNIKIDTFASVNISAVAVNPKKIEKISKALGDTSRLKILMHISKKGGCGQCADIQNILGLAQPSISHHIKILLEAELIETEKEGRNHKYILNEALLDEYTQFLGNLKV